MRALVVVGLMCGAVVSGAVGGRVAYAADEAPLDLIVMKDGALVRGHVVEMVPNARIVIQIATGETRTVEWAQIARTEGPSFAPISSAPPAPTQPPVQPTPIVIAEPLLTPAPGRVPLQVESTGQQLRVGEPVGTGTAYNGRDVVTVRFGRTVCSTPCTLHVAPGSVGLWVEGAGQRTRRST